MLVDYRKLHTKLPVDVMTHTNNNNHAEKHIEQLPVGPVSLWEGVMSLETLGKLLHIYLHCLAPPGDYLMLCQHCVDVFSIILLVSPSSQLQEVRKSPGEPWWKQGGYRSSNFTATWDTVIVFDWFLYNNTTCFCPIAVIAAILMLMWSEVVCSHGGCSIILRCDFAVE